MILGFFVLLVILVLFFQQWTIENSLDALEGDFWPEENIVDPEETFDVTVSLVNKSGLPLFYIKIGSCFIGNQAETTTWLGGRQRAEIKIPVKAAKRGRYILERPNLYCGDFLGIKEQRKEMERLREVVVAPREYHGMEAKQVLGKFLGDHSVRRFLYEDPVLTVGFREYSGREPMKMISWKQSAQRQRLMVKEYDYTVEPVISVLVNVETNLEEKRELLEKCFSMARTVCRDLEARGFQYDFYTNALMAGGSGEVYSVSEGLGERHFARVMELLGRSTYVNAFSFEKLLHMTQESGGKERGKIIITPDTGMIGFSQTEDQELILDASIL